MLITALFESLQVRIYVHNLVLYVRTLRLQCCSVADDMVTISETFWNHSTAANTSK